MKALPFAGKADAYLEWAQCTRFALVGVGPAREAGLLIEAEDGSIETTEAALAADHRLDVHAWGNARRLELATPIAKPAKIEVEVQVVEGGVPAVLGVIDDGCPFARPAFMSGQRVQMLWQQGAWQSTGQQWNAQALQAAYQKGGRDDARAYASLGLRSLRRRATHGAHVLDVFAGPVAPRERVSPSRMKSEGKGADGSAHRPPPWTEANDIASRAPIVFVQLPQEAVEDPTGRWLGRYVLDGVDFIVEAARQIVPPAGAHQPRPRVVINVSWGPQTGPHDGSSLLERALAQRIQAAQKALDLHLVLPSGNSHEARAHAQWPANEGHETLHWQVMPDAGHPQFLEVWWPAGTQVANARLSVTAPDGKTFGNLDNLGQGQHGAVEGAAGAWLVVVPHPGTAGARQMALLALAPTRPGAGRPTALHGRWTLRIDKDSGRTDGEPVHAYVARNAANMNARRHGPDSYLFDPAYESTRHGRWPRQEPDTSRVRRAGTFSGLATGQGVTVVGGYVLARERQHAGLAAPYTSAGPGAGRGSRASPDWSQPSDESPYLRGIRAGGVRDGTSVRLVGTSTAAPQLARKLANDDPLVPLNGRSARHPAPAPAPPPDPRLGDPLPMKKDVTL